jgi:phosphatidylserine/phosphatidylglycerophosphate/cardiolipin synthase-like enzyme
MKLKVVLFLVVVFLISCSFEVLETELVKEDVNSPVVYFCPSDDCEGVFLKYINNAEESIHCALFDLDLEWVLSSLSKKSEEIDVKIVVDDNNWNENFSGKGIIKDSSSQLSHNKFCVFDRKILWTGSFNPTFNGAYKNNNNIIVIESLNLANNYELEFEELWNYNFGKGRETVEPIVYLNEKKYASYFCPEDNCKYKVVEELKLSEKSIYFMVFSFTDFDIADLLIVKNKEVEIKGVLESKRVNMQYNQYKKLVENDVNVRKDSNSFIMHHKVFIIDNNTVITGSYNPTKAGNTKNDENILIIKDKKVVSRYLKEFESVFVSSLE